MEQRSPLSWLGYPARESTSRDLLGWLLEASGSSALESLVGTPIGRIHSVASEQLLDVASVDDDRKRSRIDLLVCGSEALVGVEVKVRSRESAGQLRRYIELLRKRAGKRRAVLVFVTESGAEPEYPAQLHAFAQRTRVDYLTRTWDELAARIPEDAPLGWRDAALRRGAELRERVDSACTAGWSADRRDTRPTPEEWNCRARALLEYARQVGGDTGLEIVLTPARGSNAPDLQVDLARPEWTVVLGEPTAAIEPFCPFGDGRLRLAARVRLHVNAVGALAVNVGLTFIPYTHFIPKELRSFIDGSALTQGWKAREQFARGIGGKHKKGAVFSAVLPVMRRTHERVPPANVARAVAAILPALDREIAQWGVASQAQQP